MLKISSFMQNNMFYAKSVYLRYALMYSHAIFLNSGESHVIVTSFTHIHSGLQQYLIF